jgi:hypothetical protein
MCAEVIRKSRALASPKKETRADVARVLEVKTGCWRD